jgi:hypothetical protein
MPAEPTIPNLLTQIAISGTATPQQATAPEAKTIADLLELGLDHERVRATIQKAIDLGIIERTADQKLRTLS